MIRKEKISLDVLPSGIAEAALAFIECAKSDLPATGKDVKGLTKKLATLGMFGDLKQKTATHYLIRKMATASGIVPASIQDLYAGIGNAKYPSDLTIPALNVRAVAYDTALAIFAAIEEHNVGAVIFELSRGEIGFTQQRPMQYTSSILCAAIASGFKGAIFFQGDHYQMSPSKFAEDKELEVNQLTNLIKEAVAAGFYNIDVDTSTLVDLSKPTVKQQQELNYFWCAHFTNICRQVEPEGVTISVGGEIGEVGEHNTTEEEVDAFMEGLNEHLEPSVKTSISKLSVQTGTKHGGNVLPDGSLGDMDINFEHLAFLGDICRSKHNLGGVVQHGASTLPWHKFNGFPKAKCLEIHLAATLLNTVYDEMPDELEQEAYSWLKKHFMHEWSETMTEPQFLYHARRFSVGPFQQKWWEMDEQYLANIRASLTQQVGEFFVRLNVNNTKDLIESLPTPRIVDIDLQSLYELNVNEYEVLTDLAD